MKDDTKRIMRARHLQAQVINVYIEPGFDMFRFKTIVSKCR